MGASACEENSANWCAASAAGLTCPQVDAMLQLEETAHSVGVDIIRNRGAAEADGMLQHGLQRRSQAFQFGPGQPAGTPARTDAGAEQALIGVDVAYAGEEGLVEEGRFDGHLSAAKECCKLVRANGERLFASSAKGCVVREIYQFQAAKAARVNEANLAAAGQGETGMSVTGYGPGGGGYEETTGHAEVNDPLCRWLVC